MLPRCLLLALLVFTFAARAEELPLAPAVECSPRGGLPNFFAKLETGGEANIGYLGGSITAQEGWRPKTLAHFQKAYPKTKISQINAAIGGTGSDLGVFRVRQDVLEKKPDLLFVEFAVNDGGASPDQIYKCMEGIVRQTWRTLPECDICFVYTLTEALAPPMLEGKFQRSASAMEKVAGHYGIPTIHMGMEVAKLAREGKLLWKAPLPKTPSPDGQVAFAPDSVHPHPETGHELYLAAVVRSLEPIKAVAAKAGAHTLGAPFTAGNYEKAQLLPITAAKLSAGFMPIAQEEFGKRFVPRLPALHRATSPGETVSLRFKGTVCAFYDVVAPDGGQIKVTLDDQPAKLVPRFDSYCTYARLSKFTVASDVPDGEHTIKIELTAEPLDKAKILAQRGGTITDPAKFSGLAFYPGAILLVGEILP